MVERRRTPTQDPSTDRAEVANAVVGGEVQAREPAAARGVHQRLREAAHEVAAEVVEAEVQGLEEARWRAQRRAQRLRARRRAGERAGHAQVGDAVAGCLHERNTEGYSSTYLAMGFANVRAGTWYPPEH